MSTRLGDWEEREKEEDSGERVRDACYEKPLLFISFDTGIHNVLFCSVMISFEKSILTSQFPVNKVTIYEVWTMLRSTTYLWLFMYWQLMLSEIGGRNTKTLALIADAPFPFPFRAFLPLPLSFLRLPRRLNKRSFCYLMIWKWV